MPLASAADGSPFRRKLTDTEVASRCDFADQDRAWKDAVNHTVTAWNEIQTEQRRQIVAAVQTAVDDEALDRLADYTVDTQAAENLLFGRMQLMAQRSGDAQQREAQAQGVEVPEWSLDDEVLTASAFRDQLRQVASATAKVLGGRLVSSAVQRARQLFGSGTGRQVADRVDEGLRELSDAPVREQVGAAMTTAQNAGRMAVLQVAPQAKYVSSEIQDRVTCAECSHVDGTEYATLAEARADYPSGGYIDCLGGYRCRGTLVTVWPAEASRTAAGTIKPGAGATMPPHANPETKGGGTVPYSIVQDHADCAADMPWGVTKDDTGELMGCHGTEDGAEAQRRALYAEEGDMADGLDLAAEDPRKPKDGYLTEWGGQTAPWEGVLLVEGQVTGDGREFMPDALTWQEPPIPLRWNKEDSHGGEPRTVAVNVGRIDEVWRDGDKIMGKGALNLGEEDGRRVHDMIKGKFLRGVSIDADSIANPDIEFVWPDDVNEGVDDDADGDLFEMLFGQPEKVIYHGGRIRGATLCDIPAFVEAWVALLDDMGTVIAGGKPLAEEEWRALAVKESAPSREQSVVAAAGDGPWRPPAAWFADPKLSVPTGITVTDDGRLYGHAAQWGSCHIGQEGVCVQPPREDAHPYYMTGELTCDDGSTVAVGQITVGTGHAPLHLGAGPAAEHYDDTGAAVADVAVGNDRHGIWVAGAVRPGADPDRVHELRAAGQVSGDWRRIGGSLRLVGLLAVNVPGFPVPRMRARVASGRQEALVAAGRPTVAHGLSAEEEQARALRVVMGMLRDRVHKGGD